MDKCKHCENNKSMVLTLTKDKHRLVNEVAELKDLTKTLINTVNILAEALKKRKINNGKNK